MKIQLAIDRVTIEEALNLIEQTKDSVDIIEIGTSLIKEYGMHSIVRIRNAFPDVKILADIKTIDEAEYEFRKVYEAGADIATVMGAAAISSIDLCDRVAKEYHREYMIDLLEVEETRILQLKKYKNAIFAIHLPSDEKGAGLDQLVKRSLSTLAGVEQIAIAGGVTIETMELMNESGIDIVIIGGAITKAKNPAEAAREFARVRR